MEGQEQESEDCFLGVLMEGFGESPENSHALGSGVCGLWAAYEKSRTRNPSGHALTQTLRSNIWYYEYCLSLLSLKYLM